MSSTSTLPSLHEPPPHRRTRPRSNSRRRSQGVKRQHGRSSSSSSAASLARRPRPPRSPAPRQAFVVQSRSSPMEPMDEEEREALSVSRLIRVRGDDAVVAVPQHLVVAGGERPKSEAEARVQKAVAALPNPVEDAHTFAQVGVSAVLEAQPAVVHFGGFTPGQAQRVVVSVVNVSPTETQRVQLLPPSTPYFQMKFVSKKPTVGSGVSGGKRGVLPPGMSEDVEITFRPSEWRYYYDSIKVHSSSGDDANLLIPIHAYPVMNSTRFPTRIDLGNCQVGESIHRTKSLSCQVPIDFEYSIRILHDDASFSVWPLQGTIPANGEVDIHFQFVPTRRVTCELELELDISQFGFEPVRVTVIASAVAPADPTVARRTAMSQRELGPGLQGTRAVLREGGAAAMMLQSLVRTRRHELHLEEQAMEQLLVEEGIDLSSDRSVRTKPRRRKRRPRRKDESEEDYELGDVVDDYVMPPDLYTTSGVNFILHQEEGKKSISQIKEAVERRRAEQQAKEEALRQQQERHDAGSQDVKRGKRAHPLDFSDQPNLRVEFDGDDRQMQELIFRQALAEYDQHEKMLEVNPTKARIGQVVMSAEQRDELETQLRERARQQREEDEARARARHHREALTSEEERVVGPSGDRTTAAHVDFDVFKNDDWSARSRALRRFVSSVSKVVVRMRTARRLQAVRLALGLPVDLSAEPVIANDDGPVLDVEKEEREATEIVDRSEPPAEFRLALERVRPVQFPSYDGSHSAIAGAPTQIEELPYFAAPTLLRLQVPSEAAIAGYPSASEPAAAPVQFAPLPPEAMASLLRIGALEETADGGVTTAQHEAPEEVETMPECLAMDSVQSSATKPREFLAPRDSIFSTPSSAALPQLAPSRAAMCETHAGYALRPTRLRDGRASDTLEFAHLREVPGSDSLQALAGSGRTRSSVVRNQWDTPEDLDVSAFFTVPGVHGQLLKRRPADDELSDSDTDEDEEHLEFREYKPSLELARGLFEEEEVEAGNDGVVVDEGPWVRAEQQLDEEETAKRQAHLRYLGEQVKDVSKDIVVVSTS